MADVADVSKVEEGNVERRISGRTISKGHRFLTFWWLFVAFAGFGCSLGGLSALQHNVNKGYDSDSWIARATYPDVVPHRLFSFDWYVVFLQLVLFAMVAIAAAASGMVAGPRVALVGLMAAGAVLNSISANRMYSVRAVVARNYSASTAAFVGFLLSAMADYSLVYMLGVDPTPSNKF